MTGTRPVFIVFLGMPGAGKGTQVQKLSHATSLPHISTGALFREHLHQATDLGLLAQSYMNRGDLVPDDVTINMARERLARPDCARGALLDGFPRNLVQADAMAAMAAAQQGTTRAICLSLAEEACRERITGRRQCRACGAVYHIRFNPPAQANACDQCRDDLYQRGDDTDEALATRLLAYYRETSPLLGYYHALGTLVTLSADGTPDAVATLVRGALQVCLDRI